MPIGQECPDHADPSDNDNSKNGILIYSSVLISLLNVTMPLRKRSGFRIQSLDFDEFTEVMLLCQHQPLSFLSTSTAHFLAVNRGCMLEHTRLFKLQPGDGIHAF